MGSLAKQSVFPRWKGFNILGMFCSSESYYNDFRSPGYFTEEDFKMMADWGFDFVRLPLSYRLWSDHGYSPELERPAYGSSDPV